MANSCALNDEVKQHIKMLEKEIAEYEAKKETLTEEEIAHLKELRRKLYRSKVRNHCC